MHEDNTKETKELAIDKDGKFGIQAYINPKRFEELGYYDIFTKEYTFGQSFAAGGHKFTKTITNYFDQLKAIFSPSTGAYKGLVALKRYMINFHQYGVGLIFGV